MFALPLEQATIEPDGPHKLLIGGPDLEPTSFAVSAEARAISTMIDHLAGRMVSSIAVHVEGVRAPATMKPAKRDAAIVVASSFLDPDEELVFVADAIRMRAPRSTLFMVTKHRLLLIATSGTNRITWWCATGDARAEAKSATVLLHRAGEIPLKVPHGHGTVQELADLINGLAPLDPEARGS